MSEYQYYEFLALDRQLTKNQITEIRKVSSRAEISSTRFTNEYNYGDFRGDEQEFLEKYFDVMVYVANWGTHRFMLALDKEIVDMDFIKQCCAGDSFSFEIRKSRLILDFSSNTEEHEWEEGSEWMDVLSNVRTEICQGDTRAFYLGWLLSVQSEGLDDLDENDLDEEGDYDDYDNDDDYDKDLDDNDDILEPEIPPELKNLSASLKSLVEFLRIDEDLLAVAAENSPTSPTQTQDQSHKLAQWISSLPETEKNSLLLEIVQSQQLNLAARLLQRFHRETVCKQKTNSSIPKRTVKELLEQAKQRKERRKKEEEKRLAEKRAKEKAEAEKKRSAHLESLIPRQEGVWKEIIELIASSKPKSYDEATGKLIDLRDISIKTNSEKDFQTRFNELCQKNSRKPSLITRFKDAKLMD
jgi:hypothetical protein